MSERMEMRHIEESISIDAKKKKGWRDIFEKHLKTHSEQGLYLKGIRLREGYTQKELGQLIGVSQNNISAMEHGKRPIGKAMAKKLAEILNTDYRMFL